MLKALELPMQRWEETRHSVRDWLDQFPEDRLRWAPGGSARPAASIVYHIGKADARYTTLWSPSTLVPDSLRSLLSGLSPQWPLDGEAWADTAVRLTLLDTKDGIHQFLGQVDAYVRAGAAQATEADLLRTCATEWQPLTARVTGNFDGLWFVEQMTRHTAYHLGQLWYISQLLEE